MQTINRNNDVISGNSDLEHLHTFKNFPILMGCTDFSKSEDLFTDMSWYISKSSGAIQLNPLLPLDILYETSHGPGTSGKVWKGHHRSLAEFICKHNANKVLEIGGWHGILSEKAQEINDDIDWTIIDPAASSGLKAKVIHSFFDENFIPEEEYDSVVHSHVLEHIYDINAFMGHIGSFMNNGKLIFSIPNMDVMIKNKSNNCLNFEHTILLGEDHVKHLLSKHGFEVIDKLYYNDHSIFYCAIRNSDINTIKMPEDSYDNYRLLFEDYINFNLDDVRRLNKIINNTSAPAYLFGAHIFSQYLFGFGLNPENITGILDNDLSKEGKRLYGTDLISNSPKSLKGTSEAIIILRAGAYNNEIKEDITNNINPNIIFI